MKLTWYGHSAFADHLIKAVPSVENSPLHQLGPPTWDTPTAASSV